MALVSVDRPVLTVVILRLAVRLLMDVRSLLPKSGPSATLPSVLRRLAQRTRSSSSTRGLVALLELPEALPHRLPP